MKVLVLGGTRFLGRHLVTSLLARNHEVTLFNRGRTASGLFPDAEEIHGDRGSAEGLTALVANADARWDTVIDTCGYLPRVVRASCEALRGRVRRYCFVSSISVYKDLSGAEIDETAEVAHLDDPATEDIAAHYGALKAACEREVMAAFGDEALIVRPGLIVGPFDPTGRFSYWPRRLAAGGEVLAPGDPADPVQLIDARDLAQWMVRALTRAPGGVYNVTGPAQPTGFGSLLAQCAAGLQPANPLSITWCSEAFLLAQGVEPWMGLPLWVTAADQGMQRVSIKRALDAGLALRPLAETAADTLAWLQSPQFVAPAPPYATVGLTPLRESELLAAWHAAQRA